MKKLQLMILGMSASQQAGHFFKLVRLILLPQQQLLLRSTLQLSPMLIIMKQAILPVVMDMGNLLLDILEHWAMPYEYRLLILILIALGSMPISLILLLGLQHLSHPAADPTMNYTLW